MMMIIILKNLSLGHHTKFKNKDVSICCHPRHKFHNKAAISKI